MRKPFDRCSEERYDELWKEALGLLSVPDGEKDQEQARIGVEDVIRRFQLRLESWKASPKFTDLRDQLDQISTSARELGRLLDTSWPYAQAAAAGYCSVDDWLNQDRFVFFEQVIEGPEQVCTVLPKIAEAADQIRSRLPAQKGGGRSLEERFHGLPKAVLAVHCWELFHHYRPGEAKTTDGGDYHTLTSIIYEMASGEGSDSPGVGLEHYVKNAAIVCRDLIEQNPALERLRHALPPGESPVGFLSESTAIADWYGIPRRVEKEIRDDN
jgi:hypothetical protein